jgi:hypothetical protein
MIILTGTDEGVGAKSTLHEDLAMAERLSSDN